MKKEDNSVLSILSVRWWEPMLILGTRLHCSSGSRRGGKGATTPPLISVKISHKKHGHQRWSHRFHVSRPLPYPTTGSATALASVGHVLSRVLMITYFQMFGCDSSPVGIMVVCTLRQRLRIQSQPAVLFSHLHPLESVVADQGVSTQGQAEFQGVSGTIDTKDLSLQQD